MTRRRQLAVAGTLLGVAAGIVGIVTSIGEVATLPVQLTVFFTGFGGGASLASLVARHRADR